ncbi:hypothetical protein YB2330_006319 [Saitoella coloradoensis]
MPNMPGPIKDSNVDVLIIGAGPAGLMAANWFARFSKQGLTCRIIDKRSDKIFTGQADGLQCRTLEVFETFGFADRVWKESNHMLEICFWNPDENGVINRTGRIPDTIPGISHYQQVVLHQGRIERFFLDAMSHHGNIHVERSILPESLTISPSSSPTDSEYPVKVQVRHLSLEESTPSQFGSSVASGLFRQVATEGDVSDAPSSERAGDSEIINAKYVIGCDGAHSWTRAQIGAQMHGEQTDYIWGVLDGVPITDFPDIRMRCAIHSEGSGSVMVIPRERGVVRLYIQLAELDVEVDGQKKRVDRSKITADMILKAAQKIVRPYTLEMEDIEWFTAYQIGQRVTDRFTNVDTAAAQGEPHPRVFIAGDACHTHSPKAGQGMNTSMMDTYNLSWKIAHAALGYSAPSILSTYESERRLIARDLIAFDHKFSRLFSGKPAKNGDDMGISLEEFKKVFEKGNLFASGTAVDYGPSAIVAKDGKAVPQYAEPEDTDDPSAAGVRTVSRTGLSTKILPGQRVPSTKVLNHSDARPWHLNELLKSTGKWRIVPFLGDPRSTSQMSRIHALATWLDSENSPWRRYTPPTLPVDALFDTLSIHSAPRAEVEWFSFPPALRRTYNSLYVDDASYHEGHGHAYDFYGVHREKGCLVVLRPDGYVAFVGELEDTDRVDEFFEGFMRVPQGCPRGLGELRRELGAGMEVKARAPVDVQTDKVGQVVQSVEELAV